jgi:hypothetical protein
MRRYLLNAAAGLCLASLAGLGTAWANLKPEGLPVLVEKEKPACGQHGTSIDFLENPSAAAKQAKKDEKLVFVLHVSGHFENPKFT